MKNKSWFWLNLAALMVLSVVPMFHHIMPARADNLFNITNNNYADITPQINAKGQVCWSGWDGHDYEIYFYNGSSTIAVTNNSYDDVLSQINANGQIVWSGFDGNDWEIYYYNNGGTNQITNNNYDDGHYELTIEGQPVTYGPKLNDYGTVTWSGWDGADYEIYVYDQHYNKTIQVTNNSYDELFPFINDASGTVVWSGYDGQDYEIYLYDSYSGIIFNNPKTPEQITNNNNNDLFPQLNEVSQIAWCVYDGNDWEINFHDYFRGISTQLTNNNYNDYLTGINNLCRILWQGYDGNDWEVYLYSNGDGTTTQITNNNYNDINPQINPGGWIVWNGYNGADGEIFIYRDNAISQLTNNDYADGQAQINGSGQIVWAGNDGNDTEIYRITTGSGTLSRYDFTYHFAGGDYYSGYFYALSNTVYEKGDTFTVTDENGEQGYYEITQVMEIGYINTWAGEIVNTSYYDADSNQTYVPVTAYTRKDYLGSENDDIIQAMVGGYHFAGGFFEADSWEYRCYTYTYTYGNGDYYTGRMYLSSDHGPEVGDFLETTDENGLIGQYLITGYTSLGTDSSHQGEMFIDSYYDSESQKTFTPVSYGSPVGSVGGDNWQPNEHDYIIQEGIPEFYFGAGYYEADIGDYSRYDFIYYYSSGSSDYYTGYVYAPTSFQSGDLQFAVGKKLYDQPQTFWSQGYKSFNGGYYQLTAITDGFASAYDKQCYITAYYDVDTAKTSLGVNSDGSPTAGYIYVSDRTAAWETGYAISGSNQAAFNPYSEADVPLSAASPALGSSAPSPSATIANAAQSQAQWAVYWGQTARLTEEENHR